MYLPCSFKRFVFCIVMLTLLYNNRLKPSVQTQSNNCVFWLVLISLPCHTHSVLHLPRKEEEKYSLNSKFKLLSQKLIHKYYKYLIYSQTTHKKMLCNRISIIKTHTQFTLNLISDLRSFFSVNIFIFFFLHFIIWLF